ncbi:MAG: TIGR02530 family flagellar biosynthesis protein [Armatimonadota bacterium]|nr:hypothetical protein [bacterium]
MSPVRLDASITGISGKTQGQGISKQANNGSAFESALATEMSKSAGVKLSAHAQKRLAERNLQFGEEEQARVGSGMDKINAKGADKSLVLMDDLALVVSARNRVVITAVDSGNARDAVFTDIDSAVIV